MFLGRVQPYSVCLPATYAPGRKLPLTLLLHSLALGQNQFAAIGPRLLHQVCEDRDSVVVTPLARGPSCWYFDEGELDVWEVWARVAEQLGTDPNRTVIAGYSMGGYGAYKLALTYPEVFAQAVVLAGPPACGVRLLPDVDIPGDLDPDSHCAREGDTLRLLVNARWLPFVIAHGVLDELVPHHLGLVPGARARPARLPLSVHRLSVRGPHHLGARGRVRRSGFAHGHRSSPGRPRTHHLRVVSGAGAARSGHRAAPGLVVVGPDGRSGLRPPRGARSPRSTRGRHARPDPTRTTRRRRGFEPDLDLSPGLYTELVWRIGSAVEPLPFLTLQLTRVAGLTVDVARAGLASLRTSTINVVTDTLAQVKLAALPPNVTVLLDGQPTGPTVAVPVGRHTITLTTT